MAYQPLKGVSGQGATGVPGVVSVMVIHSAYRQSSLGGGAEPANLRRLHEGFARSLFVRAPAARPIAVVWTANTSLIRDLPSRVRPGDAGPADPFGSRTRSTSLRAAGRSTAAGRDRAAGEGRSVDRSRSLFCWPLVEEQLEDREVGQAHVRAPRCCGRHERFGASGARFIITGQARALRMCRKTSLSSPGPRKSPWRGRSATGE